MTLGRARHRLGERGGRPDRAAHDPDQVVDRDVDPAQVDFPEDGSREPDPEGCPGSQGGPERSFDPVERKVGHRGLEVVARLDILEVVEERRGLGRRRE